MKTILAATLLTLSATSAAAQTTFYGPGGDYWGKRHGTATLRPSTMPAAARQFRHPRAFDQLLWSRWFLSGHLDPHRRRHELL